jgi:Homing endonuclease associated repeat
MGLKEDQHILLQDVLAVAKDLGRIPTRDEYQNLGRFSKDKIVKEFGSWTHLMQASGLEYTKGKPSKGEIKYDREVEKYEVKRQILSKFEKEIKPYHGKFDRLNKDIFSIVSITDSHSEFRDEFTWLVCLDYCKEAQPDLIVLGGDILECYDISQHNKNPQRAYKIQDEIDFVVLNKLAALRFACPNAQIDYHLGNHEARLFKYLCMDSPALSSLRCLQFDKLLGLEDLAINLIGRESFVFKTKMEENYKVYRGLWAWTHGVDCTQFPALKEMNKYNVSGASGHVHRHTAFAKRDVGGFKTWMSVGASCTNKVGLEYMPGLIGWERGFLLTFVHPKNVIQQHISTEGGFACVGGVFYNEKEMVPG